MSIILKTCFSPCFSKMSSLWLLMNWNWALIIFWREYFPGWAPVWAVFDQSPFDCRIMCFDTNSYRGYLHFCWINNIFNFGRPFFSHQPVWPWAKITWILCCLFSWRWNDWFQIIGVTISSINSVSLSKIFSSCHTLYL